jgi:hypothetical protein
MLAMRLLLVRTVVRAKSIPVQYPSSVARVTLAAWRQDCIVRPRRSGQPATRRLDISEMAEENDLKRRVGALVGEDRGPDG